MKSLIEFDKVILVDQGDDYKLAEPSQSKERKYQKQREQFVEQVNYFDDKFIPSNPLKILEELNDLDLTKSNTLHVDLHDIAEKNTP